jgi:predicted amidohydrolase
VAELSRRLPLTFGFVERAGDGQLYNACGYFEDGELRHVHRKVYLPTYGMFEEGRFFARGDRIEAFDTAFGRLVILNCEDIWHPSSAMLAQLDGTEGLILMSAAPGRGVSGATPVIGSRAAWHDILRTFARLLICWTAWSNRVGFEDGIFFSGGSAVYAPYSETPLAEAPMLAAGVTTAAVDREAIARLRAGNGQLREENPEVVRAGLETLLAGRLPERERTP